MKGFRDEKTYAYLKGNQQWRDLVDYQGVLSVIAESCCRDIRFSGKLLYRNSLSNG